MDTYDGGGYGWGNPAVKTEGQGTRLRCDDCGGYDFEGPSDGFYYCRFCGAQSQDVIDAACAEEDILGDAGENALYNITHHRKKSHLPTSKKNPNLDQILRNLSQTRAPEEEKQSPPPRGGFGEGVSELQDFGAGGYVLGGEDLAEGIRIRYVQGLQVMLQQQCEGLVDKFGVSPMICGIAGTVWFRYLAVSRVLDDGWADKVIAESEAEAEHSQGSSAQEWHKVKPIKPKYRSEPHNKYGRRSIYIWIHSLKKAIPMHSTLAISFLVCHLMREAVLPTDISDWALEGKLPYLTAFVDMDKYLGLPSPACPLSSRFLFRPLRVIGAWHLEAMAGSIAQSIGLRIPSVNFFAIARRYLKELSLPVDKILPHACRLFEWSIPQDLWLSSNCYRLPTRVCVMSIIIVTIRILYDINGKGTWESSPSDLNSSLLKQKVHRNFSQELGKGGDRSNEDHCSTDSVHVHNLSHTQASEFNTEDLLRILKASFYSINITHDYSKDLLSYLKYCKDIVFAGRTASFEEERLIEGLWNIYEKNKDSNLKEEITAEYFNVKEKRPRDEVPTSTFLDSKKMREGQESPRTIEAEIASHPNDTMGQVEESLVNNNTSTADRSNAIEELKLCMEEDGFQYLPPRTRKQNNGYLHYKRQRADGKLIYVAHTDYYILLRACARLARVDVRIMHVGALKLEKRLEWLEEQIGSSLSSLTQHDSLTCTH